jgi:tetratricopeptide (TPR) repeat protein
MRSVVIALQVLVPLCLVACIYAFTMRDQVQLVRRVQRDDWAGVRDAAARIIDRRSRWIPRAVRAQAMHLLGLAQLVLGDLPAARTALEHALATDLPAPERASTERHLAAVERAMGDVDGARARLAAPQACASDGERWALAAHRSHVLLAAGDPAGAEQASLIAVTALEHQVGSSHLPMTRAAFTADLTQARCTLVRTRIDQGDLDGAASAWAQVLHDAPDDKPYVQGQVAETGSRLTLATGDRDTASELLETARARYGRVGARVELARMAVLRARIDRSAPALDAAEAALRQLGALGFLREVDEARREIA